MKSQAGYLRDADYLLPIVRQDGPESTNARLRSLAEHIWFAARDARKDEHLHYCAVCRHGSSCSRMLRIRKGIS